MGIRDVLRRLGAQPEVEPVEPEEEEGGGGAPRSDPGPPGELGPAGAADFQAEPVELPSAVPALTVVFEDGREVTVPLLGGETLAVERSWRADGFDQRAPVCGQAT